MRQTNATVGERCYVNETVNRRLRARGCAEAILRNDERGLIDPEKTSGRAVLKRFVVNTTSEYFVVLTNKKDKEK